MATDSEREKIEQEIRELERILEPSSSRISVELCESSLDSESDADSLLQDEDSDAPDPPISEEDRWGEASNEEEDPKDRNLPEDPETCLQLNMVYQEVLQEKLTEVHLLLAQNRAQQEEIMGSLAGSKVKVRKSLPPHMFIGHFMKPYFKDKVTGVGPPANEDMREKAAQGVKSFEELLVTKWKSWEKTLLRKSVISDRLQRLLQPKLLKLEYLQQKQSQVSGETEKQLLDKQIRDTEKDMEDIHQLSEEALLGTRQDNHDWEKISNVNFEGGRSAEEIRKFWQNCEHPSINKQEWSEEEVEQLKVISAQHGHLEWQEIAEELGTQRSAFQCLQKFQQHNRDLKRKEWTEEEDRMLTQLVQEMRVGSHIPYRRIVYYMEGRDSMQLIYRWTKSLDPSLRRGCWTPEEDSKLLQAVAKHGAQDWFKIREEVPGRSDAQCRDRYLRRLHFSLKKGRWNPKEEEKLIELIEKHGAGHWAKIAAELPHRTGSQCLSKWKIMVRKKQRHWRRRRRPQRCIRWSSSSEESEDSGDSSSEDTETEPEDTSGASGEGEVPPPTPYVVPSMDLWVPARQCPTKLWACAQDWSGRPPVLSRPLKEAETDHHGSIQHQRLANTCPTSDQELGDKHGTHGQEVSPETVLRVLRANTAAQGRPLKEQWRRPQQPLSSRPPGPSLGSSSGPLWPPPSPHGLRRQRHRHALQRRLLNRRLLMAVGPWVGKVVLPPRQAPRRPTVQTRADAIWRQLQNSHLKSTPVFTLLIQLFQIDADGCMEVIRERKTQAPTVLHHLQAQHHAGVPTQATRQSSSHSDSRRLGTHQPRSPGPSPVLSGPRPKAKTVSQLLREKRLQEAQARRTILDPRPLPLQLLVSSPGGSLPTLQPAPQGPPAAGPPVCNMPGLGVPIGAAPGTANPLQGAQISAKEQRPHILQAPIPTLTPIGGSRNQVPILGYQRGLGQSQAPTSSRKQGLPELPLLLPAAPSPAQLPALNLVPTHVAAGTTLPVTWVLVPSSVPAMVGLPRPAVSSGPGGSVTLLPSPASPPRAAPTLHSPAEATGERASALGAAPPQPAASSRSEAEPPSSQPCPKKGPLATSLLSLEEAGDTQAWLRGQRGGCVPSLGKRLPYQPPALCTLRTLSSLLLHKETLEYKAATLVPGTAVGTEGGPQAGALKAALDMVHTRLGDSPAYLLLKARFLAAFSLPALLATLPPLGVSTTLSASTRLDSDSEDESLLGDPKCPDGVGPQARPQHPAETPQTTAQHSGLKTAGSGGDCPDRAQSYGPLCIAAQAHMCALSTQTGQGERCGLPVVCSGPGHPATAMCLSSGGYSHPHEGTEAPSARVHGVIPMPSPEGCFRPRKCQGPRPRPPGQQVVATSGHQAEYWHSPQAAASQGPEVGWLVLGVFVGAPGQQQISRPPGAEDP
ncbi:PREDICTED: snRNA-activating protein complex subunit 4 [Chrysochloris asiatica]|uniref:snRNA-activating protein complex subunit 4 n=1 Tax=Chrysochloris asiatica TaxID=185453 RepID=A0A9B0TN88_CHRAS|nr:PREDICTED: snRNA-activating protein complex subunit 4 [Chrysochloris asiatica]